MITVQYKNSSITLPKGSSLSDLAQRLHLTAPDQAVAGSIQGKLVDFSTPLQDGDLVEIFSFADPKGKEVYWHTSAHVLAQAVLRLWPEALPTIGPPIESGFYYDFANLHLSEEDFERIEQEIEKILTEHFVPQKECFSSSKEALDVFAANPYKKELIEEFKDSQLTAYRQGEFLDLCRGPHLPGLNKIKAVKILKTSGAYWRGDSKKEMLTRIYAISFPDRKLLKEYLHQIEEAKKRDHKILGPRLGLFTHLEEAPGMAFFYPKGMKLRKALLAFWEELHEEAGYQFIETPQLVKKELWEISGHWQNYRHNMYTSSIEEKEYAIKPMNCPGCMLLYKTEVHSYREFPLRLGEIGHVHRHEASGALSGLMRVRSFHQDDAHIFMEPHQIEDEILAVLHLMDRIYSTFGLSYHLELSTRPEKDTIGTDAQWEHATSSLQAALDRSGKPYIVRAGEGAFYGPKIDLHIKDAIGRTWQCGTVQLDMALPERFALEYVDREGKRVRPIMIHRALFGSIERFMGILIEHFAGRFPLWLSPRQVRIIPVADRHLPYAQSIMKELHSFHCEVDDSHESVSKKIRLAQLEQVNYMLTVGDQEMETKTVSVRSRDNQVRGGVSLSDFRRDMEQERASRSL